MKLAHLRKRYGAAFVIALLVLYLPQTWIVWFAIQAPRDITLQWLAMFPVLPGLFIAAVFRDLYFYLFAKFMPDSVLLLIALFFSVILIAILTIIGARGKGWQIIAGVFGLAYGVLAALGLHAAYRV